MTHVEIKNINPKDTSKEVSLKTAKLHPSGIEDAEDYEDMNFKRKKQSTDLTKMNTKLNRDLLEKMRRTT